ncbi:MAG: GNAT family protein [Bdellovibrionota bacterium]
MTIELPTKPIYLETKRLLLRPFCDDDCHDLHGWASSINVTRQVNWDRHRNLDETREFIRIIKELSERNSLIFMAVELKSTKQAIGSVGIFQRSDLSRYTLELGYCLGEQWWGSGYILEASLAIVDYGFLTMHYLERVEANCVVENHASRRIMEKIGMQREGVLRNFFEKDGKMHNSYMYSVLRQEWMSKHHPGSY